jgi:hypothetical protein
MTSFSETVDFLSQNVQPGDLVLTMGAGDVFKVADEFLKSSGGQSLKESKDGTVLQYIDILGGGVFG